MKRVKPTCKNISPNQRRLRLMELSGIPITENQKKRILNENSFGTILPMKYHDRMKIQSSVTKSLKDEVEDEDDIDLDEILREMGYDNLEDLEDDFESDEEEDESVSNLSKTELKQMIRDVVMDTLDEEDDLNEIIENLTKT